MVLLLVPLLVFLPLCWYWREATKLPITMSNDSYVKELCLMLLSFYAKKEETGSRSPWTLQGSQACSLPGTANKFCSEVLELP